MSSVTRVKNKPNEPRGGPKRTEGKGKANELETPNNKTMRGAGRGGAAAVALSKRGHQKRGWNETNTTTCKISLGQLGQKGWGRGAAGSSTTLGNMSPTYRSETTTETAAPSTSYEWHLGHIFCLSSDGEWGHNTVSRRNARTFISMEPLPPDTSHQQQHQCRLTEIEKFYSWLRATDPTSFISRQLLPTRPDFCIPRTLRAKLPNVSKLTPNLPLPQLQWRLPCP